MEKKQCFFYFKKSCWMMNTDFHFGVKLFFPHQLLPVWKRNKTFWNKEAVQKLMAIPAFSWRQYLKTGVPVTLCNRNSRYLIHI